MASKDTDSTSAATWCTYVHTLCVAARADLATAALHAVRKILALCASLLPANVLLPWQSLLPVQALLFKQSTLSVQLALQVLPVCRVCLMLGHCHAIFAVGAKLAVCKPCSLRRSCCVCTLAFAACALDCSGGH